MDDHDSTADRPTRPTDLAMDSAVLPRRYLGRAVSTCALAIASCLYSTNWSYTGPLYLLVHVVVVGAFVTLSVLLRVPDPLSRVVDAMALLLPMVAALGAVFSSLSRGEQVQSVEECGVSLRSLFGVLEGCWPFVLLATAIVGIALWRRRDVLARMGPIARLASCVASLCFPFVLVLGSPAIASEFMRGGAGMFLIYPVLIASLCLARSWVLGVPSPTTRTLAAVAGLAAMLGVVVASVVGGSLAPECNNYTSLRYNWKLAALDGLGLPLFLLALSLVGARDFEPDASTP